MNILLRCTLALGFAAFAAYGQSRSVDWYKFAGGGGASAGVPYSVSGTIGQPEAGHLSGGSYTLDGGFWSTLAAIQTPGAPLLCVSLTATNTAVVSWPSPSTGFHLQENPIAGSTNWTAVVQAPADDGTTRWVVVSPAAGNRFYRLKNP
jgi:hypothetical protein